MKTILLTLLIVLGALCITPASDEVDPADLWVRGFLLVQAVEEQERKGSLLSALSKLDEAIVIYRHLEENHPDFHQVIVEERLRLLTEKRATFKTRLQDSVAEDESSDKAPLEDLKRRREELNRELQRIQKEIQETSEEIRQREKEMEATDSPPKQGARRDPVTEDADLLESIVRSQAGGNPNPRIPDFWIPRDYDGETTYLIPLIETDETKPFSRLAPAPAVMQGVVISVDGE